MNRVISGAIEQAGPFSTLEAFENELLAMDVEHRKDPDYAWHAGLALGRSAIEKFGVFAGVDLNAQIEHFRQLLEKNLENAPELGSLLDGFIEGVAIHFQFGGVNNAEV